MGPLGTTVFKGFADQTIGSINICHIGWEVRSMVYSLSA